MPDSLKTLRYCEDSDLYPRIPGKTGDDRGAVPLLELLEARPVDDARNHLTDVVRPPDVALNDSVDLVRIEERIFRLDPRLRLMFLELQVFDEVTDDRQRVVIVFREVIGHSADPRVHIRAPSSSAVTSSPVATRTSGGPPRKIVPVPFTMTASSDIAGTYAPPAVQEPITAAICGISAADITAWL